MPAERLQKLLAAAGYGSRRACEAYLTAGRVRVNGRPAKLGDKADPALDKITLDGEPLAPEQRVYVLLHKPRGCISSLEAPGVLDTVRQLVPVPERLYPVGRLDVASEGLLLLTNDGDLTHKLTHPRYGHEKEYNVLVLGAVDNERLDTWRRGVVIKDEAGNSERTAPARVSLTRQTGEGAWLRVILREGKKHQIRRVAETLGLVVSRLIRVRMGTLELGNLKPGQWRYLTPAEVRRLKTETQTRIPTSQKSKRPARNPKPSTRDLQPSTRNPKPSTRRHKNPKRKNQNRKA